MKAKLNLLAAMASILYGLASAEDANDPFATGPILTRPPTPDHLIPLRPYPEDWDIAYTKQLTKHLGLDEVYLARMIVKPSFGAEYLMRIHGDEKSFAFDDSKKFFVTCAQSDQSIWYSMPSNNNENIQKPIKPKTFEASIPTETARRVCRIWDEMILRTHYTRDGNDGLDGVMIEFASRYGYGETWCPNEGTSPALLLDLGESLITYCKAPTEERKKFLDAVNTSAAKLEARLKLQKAEQPGAGQPPTKPADKAPAEVKPPLPTSKDGHQ